MLVMPVRVPMLHKLYKITGLLSYHIVWYHAGCLGGSHDDV